MDNENNKKIMGLLLFLLLLMIISLAVSTYTAGENDEEKIYKEKIVKIQKEAVTLGYAYFNSDDTFTWKTSK